MSNVLIFSHEQDVDGLFSAAVLKMAHPGSQVVLTNYGLANMVAIKDKILSFIHSADPGTIVIADIGVNEESYQPVYEALDASKQGGFANIWVDHHAWPEGMIEKFSTVCEMVIGQDKKCATELCIERFAPANPVARTLGLVAHRTDFPDSARFPLPPLTGLISYYLGRQELNGKLAMILDNVMRGTLWNAEMQEDMIEASRLIDDSIEKSMAAMIVREFDYLPPGIQGEKRKARVAIARADTFVSRSILLGKVMDETEIDLAIAYAPDGKVSIRRKRDILPETAMYLDCSRIAATFREGGGHPGAAGGFLKANVKEKGDSGAVVEIESTLQNYFEELEQGKIVIQDEDIKSDSI